MDQKIGITIKAFLFLALGIVLATTLIYIASNNDNLFRSTVDYKISVTDASHISKGNAVTVNGIGAGFISDLELTERSGIIITLSIRNKYTSFINQSAVADLKTKGLLGDKFISITTSREDTMLSPGALIPVNNQAGLMDQISDLGDTMKSIDNFFSDENVESFSIALKHLKNILRKIDRGKGSLGGLVNDKDMYDKASELLDKSSSGFLGFLLGGSSKKKKAKNRKSQK